MSQQCFNFLMDRRPIYPGGTVDCFVVGDFTQSFRHFELDLGEHRRDAGKGGASHVTHDRTLDRAMDFA